jgi:DUF971 family protein
MNTRDAQQPSKDETPSSLPSTPFDKTSFPNRVEAHSASEMLLGWSTGERYAVPYFELRYYCPCAHCVDEHTGKRTIRREDVAADVKPTGVHAVGRYALQIAWSDKHSTGMYPFDLLYSICLNKGLKLA